MINNDKRKFIISKIINQFQQTVVPEVVVVPAPVPAPVPVPAPAPADQPAPAE
jgi:hypothetical protein